VAKGVKSKGAAWEKKKKKPSVDHTGRHRGGGGGGGVLIRKEGQVIRTKRRNPSVDRPSPRAERQGGAQLQNRLRPSHKPNETIRERLPAKGERAQGPGPDRTIII